MPELSKEQLDTYAAALASSYPHGTKKGVRHPVFPDVDISAMAAEMGTTLHYLSSVFKGERKPTLSFTESLGKLLPVGGLANASQLISLCNAFGPALARKKSKEREKKRQERKKFPALASA